MLPNFRNFFNNPSFRKNFGTKKPLDVSKLFKRLFLMGIIGVGCIELSISFSEARYTIPVDFPGIYF
jgi:hypothetical protein